MKILLISGHGAGDPGACRNGLKEADLTVEMVKGIKQLLDPYASVDLYPTECNAFKDIQNGNLKVNFANYNYVLEVHFNAGGGTGTEIYITSKEKGHSVEDKIVANLAKLGLRNRGVKVKDFLVIKTAKNKSVSSALLETCFIDSKADINLYKNNKSKFFAAVANGIIDGFGLKKTSGTSKPTPAPTANYYKKYVGNSGRVDVVLEAIGVPSMYRGSWKKRKAVASANGISNYTGTSAQNIKLINLAKQGKLKKV